MVGNALLILKSNTTLFYLKFDNQAYSLFKYYHKNKEV